MIPLRDNNPTRRPPVVIYVFVALNVAVFLFEVALGPQGMALFTEHFGVVPYDLTQEVRPDAWITPLTSMFMHGGWMHIIGNMWFLWIFGDNVEDSLGRGRFVVFYLLCGLGAVALQVAVNPMSQTPMIGASGAVSGVLAGYVMLFPHARILTLVPIFIFLQFVELPAYLFIFIWFGYQLLAGLVQFGQVKAGGGGVAWWAHIGGFVVGIALARLFRKHRHPPRRYAPPRFDRW
ncbi:MAG: rhomboid family intramembrane serine protease [Myxococcota bacterium]